MKVTFETEDQQEALRIVKATDMACFIFDLTRSLFREYENSEEDYKEVLEAINDLLEYHEINIDELID